MAEQMKERPDIIRGPVSVREPAMLDEQMLLRATFIAQGQPIDL